MFLDFTQSLTINSLSEYANKHELKVGVTSGCYDLTHYYHLRYWERCKKHCDILIVGVDDDYLVKKCKGNDRPIFNETHRMAMVEHSRHVDAVFSMHEIEDFERMVKLFRPWFIFKNQDFSKDNTDIEILGKKFCREVVYVDDIEEIQSTSDFIEKIKEIS